MKNIKLKINYNETIELMNFIEENNKLNLPGPTMFFIKETFDDLYLKLDSHRIKYLKNSQILDKYKKQFVFLYTEIISISIVANQPNRHNAAVNYIISNMPTEIIKYLK